MELIRRHTELSANLVSFCRFLRTKGFSSLGPKEQADALSALTFLGPPSDPDLFRLTLRAILARSLGQQQQFDELYPKYWSELEKAVDSKLKDGKDPDRPAPKGNQAPSFQALKNWLYGNQEQDQLEIEAYSAGETLAIKDFSAFSGEELREVAEIIHRIARSLALRLSRRRERSLRPAGLDIRRTLRLNLRRGGEMLELAFHRPRRMRQQLVLLCDVSKSMDLYSRFLIQFLFAFQQAYRRIETFVFSTSLHRISGQLRQRDYRTALQQLSREVPGWSGGTRIGESMKTFADRYGRLLNRQTVVIVMSDGWDTGDTEMLADAMRRIKGKAGRVIWLNPLAGNPNFRPEVKGMQAALPYIDILAPVHNLESLRALARLLRV